MSNWLRLSGFDSVTMAIDNLIDNKTRFLAQANVQEENIMSKSYIVLIILCTANLISIILCFASYLLNIGWYRFLFGIIIVPILIIHYIIHGSLIRRRMSLTKVTLLYSCLSHAALVIACIFFPDVSDAPDTYAVFGLYKNPPNFFWPLAQFSLFVSFVFTVMTKLTTPRRI